MQILTFLYNLFHNKKRERPWTILVKDEKANIIRNSYNHFFSEMKIEDFNQTLHDWHGNLTKQTEHSEVENLLQPGKKNSHVISFEY